MISVQETTTCHPRYSLGPGYLINFTFGTHIFHKMKAADNLIVVVGSDIEPQQNTI